MKKRKSILRKQKKSERNFTNEINGWEFIYLIVSVVDHILFREFGEDGEFARQQHIEFRQGQYVRVLIRNVPTEFISNFKSELPIILGGLLPHEAQTEHTMGYISARVKRHRWHKRILKSNDPLIFSIGWRRFQV
jgi:ribosome biogenesis protein BMS1